MRSKMGRALTRARFHETALLGAQALQDGEGGFFGALTFFASGSDARGAAPFAVAADNQLARFFQKQVVHAVERLAEADASRVRIIKIQVRLKEFLLSKGGDIFQAWSFFPFDFRGG